MFEADLTEACFGFIVDPVVAEMAHEAGVGAIIEAELGGRYDDLHGAPLPINAYVKTLSDGRFLLRGMARGAQANLGKMVRLVMDGIDIIVVSNRNQTFDTEPFREMGIDVTRYKIVALKSSQHFREGFKDVATEIITADPPGLTTLHIEVFPRMRKPGLLWPIDPEAIYEPSQVS
jgi:microcystin degradation protein MlrC